LEATSVKRSSDKEASRPESQIKRFVEAARELETDDDKDRFEAKLGKVARMKAKDIPEDQRPKRKYVKKRG
jgi:hypothetical protein